MYIHLTRYKLETPGVAISRARAGFADLTALFNLVSEGRRSGKLARESDPRYSRSLRYFRHPETGFSKTRTADPRFHRPSQKRWRLCEKIVDAAMSSPEFRRSVVAQDDRTHVRSTANREDLRHTTAIHRVDKLIPGPPGSVALKSRSPWIGPVTEFEPDPRNHQT